MSELQNTKPKYAVGDTVFWRDHNDEPLVYAIVAEVHPCDTHPAYYYADYTTRSGMHMRAGIAERDILGVAPRVEKDITPTRPMLPPGPFPELPEW